MMTQSFAYRNDRRNHKYRCRACWRIVQVGEPILMLRLNRATWVLHDACGSIPHPAGTWREAFTLWSKTGRA